MTKRLTRRRDVGAVLLGGSCALFLATIAWVASDVTRLQAAPAAQAPAKPSAPAPVVAAASAETYRAVYNGWKWWHVYCYRCHGVNAVGATLAPDLLAANRKLTRAAFLRAVRIGRDEKGMPEWGSLLNARQMGDLFVYVRARADKVLAAGRPDEVGPKRGVWAPPPGWVAK